MSEIKRLFKEKDFIGFFKFLRNHKLFENTIFAVIILAGVLVGIETYPDIRLKYYDLLRSFDSIILWIFVFELLVRIIAEVKNPKRLLTNSWFIFDFTIVAVCFIPYFIPEFNTEFFVVLRLARVLRMLKLFERVQNLKIIIESLVRSIPSMTYVIILLFLQFYIFAVIGTDLFGKYDPSGFGSLTKSLKSLFFVAFEGWSGIYSIEGIQNALLSGNLNDYTIVIYFISFVLLSALIFLNLFIGILTAEISQAKLEESNSKKRIFQTNHTLILGWSQQIFSIIDNLLLAHESESNSSIVVLAEKDKSQMEEELIGHVGNFRYTKMIFREGSPKNVENLRKVKPDEAKSIIILSNNDNGHHDDVGTIKQIMALKHIINDSNRDFKKDDFKIIADIDDAENARIAKSLSVDMGCIISTEEMIGKIIAQTSINSGLSKVYQEIIGFKGSEIYISSEKSLLGKTFAEVLFMYNQCIPIGIYTEKGEILINPKPNVTFNQNDNVIILSEDDSTIKVNKKNITQNTYFDKIAISNQKLNLPDSVLILGWNPKGKLVIEQLIEYLPNNSRIEIISKNSNFFEDCKIFSENGKFITIEPKLSGIISRSDLLKNDLSSVEHIILLSEYIEFKDYQACDANTLLTMINLRNIQNEFNYRFNLAVEFLNRENQELAIEQLPGDFIVGPDLVSAFISQISEDSRIYGVYDELFSYDGSEIFVRPIENYFPINIEIDFYAITEAALKCSEIAIGYLTHDGKAVMNPNKANRIQTYPGTKLYVVARK